MHKLSVVLITFNEGARIKQTLESVAWCDEIIIVDSGSTDNTIAICKQFKNCKVFNQPFVGYGEQKKIAVGYSSNDWVLSIDADEIVTTELKDEIQKILQEEKISHSNFEEYLNMAMKASDIIYECLIKNMAILIPTKCMKSWL
jgi:glycosyltransferase involved in cell wall biosynthesis